MSCLLLQIHVFDKLDYCGTLKNLGQIISRRNFQVRCVMFAKFSSWFTAWLHESISLYLSLLWWCVQFTKGDLQCGDLLTYLLSSKKIDTVLHFAAQV